MLNTNDKEISAIIESEKFVAFFDFSYGGGGSVSMLDGLCKIARGNCDKLNYISVTLIFDTPTESSRELAKKLMLKLNKDAFKRSIAQVYAVANLPGSVITQPDHYIHQSDIVFEKGSDVSIRDAVNAIAYTLRHSAGFDTELPQWWEEEDAPTHSHIEKQNIAQRVKAFLGFL